MDRQIEQKLDRIIQLLVVVIALLVALLLTQINVGTVVVGVIFLGLAGVLLTAFVAAVTDREFVGEPEP